MVINMYAYVPGPEMINYYLACSQYNYRLYTARPIWMLEYSSTMASSSLLTWWVM